MTPPPKYRDKDDLGRPKSGSSPFLHDAASNWRASTFRFRRKRRTIFVFLAICAIVYLLLHSRWWNAVLVVEDRQQRGTNDDLGSSSYDYYSSSSGRKVKPSHGKSGSHKAASADSKDAHISKFTYDGPVRFVHLYETLSRVQQFHFRLRNPHVVFIAASMNTASILAGLACEMSAAKRNVVHLVLAGRSEISIEFFKKANGMAHNDACSVVIHDARPDKAGISTDARMTLAIRSAVRYIKDYIGPTVLVTDTEREEAWFRSAVTSKAEELQIAHVTLPYDISTIPWLQKLDALSLGSWHKPAIDIVIHADAHSGRLVRLLKTLEKADYFNAPLPRLFIDLDPSTDKSVRDFITSYKWPSKDRLFVRHRILPKSSAQDDPLAFVESFFPNSENSAVLLLSPNIELSPFYYHYLFYAILEYKHSNAQSGLDPNLIYGISLDLPLTLLDGKPFDPTILSSDESPASESAKKKPNSDSPFFYAAPSTHATLFFGTHWRLLHLYLAKRLDAAYTKGVDYSLPSKISSTIPQWVSYFAELLTAGGYTMLYPNFAPSDSLAVYHPPKEASSVTARTQQDVMRSNNILNQLPNGRLPLWSELPVLGMDGTRTTIASGLTAAQKYKSQILSKCGGVKRNDGEDDSVDDLFCSNGEAVQERKRLAREHQRQRELEAQAEAEAERKALARNALEAKRREREQAEAAEKMPNKPPTPEAPVAAQPLVEQAKSPVEEEPVDDDDAPKAAGAAAAPRMPVIHNKIISLADLEDVPVEVNGETVHPQDQT
ncbi:hypothetical protein TWF696_003125 [Orbilia brochopaga]|uniref:Glycosyltransferase 2 n=1 Tax=Orbilia brochopaga TaxID=3140254 RepID=A0AAV9U029_9PEZI